MLRCGCVCIVVDVFRWCCCSCITCYIYNVTKLVQITQCTVATAHLTQIHTHIRNAQCSNRWQKRKGGCKTSLESRHFLQHPLFSRWYRCYIWSQLCFWHKIYTNSVFFASCTVHSVSHFRPLWMHYLHKNANKSKLPAQWQVIIYTNIPMHCALWNGLCHAYCFECLQKTSHVHCTTYYSSTHAHKKNFLMKTFNS